MSEKSTASSPCSINVLTLNCWGLKFISALRQPRLAEIGRQIALLEPPPDIVGLQECWTQDDFAAICSATASILPYTKFYFTGVFGGGLAILSRWPIVESSMSGYPLNGRPTAFFRGDWYVGKGIARASIKFGPGPKDLVQVFNTHTHAPYGTKPHSQYTCHRTAQAWEISKQLRSASQAGHLVIALGDFNMIPSSLAHRIISTHSPVRDAWRVIHPDSSLGPALHPSEAARGVPIPTAEYNITHNGCTSDGVYNTWRWPKEKQEKLRKGNDPMTVGPDTPDPKGKRLDYVFVSTGLSDSPNRWVVDSVSVEMTQRHPELRVSLSDHFAVRATIRRYESSTSITNTAHEAQLRLTSDKQQYLNVEDYDEILAVIDEYSAGERQQQRWRGIHFYISIPLWIACIVATPFIGKASAATAIVGSLILATGVVDGLIALLFFSWELRTIREFEWEVRNAKTFALENP